MGWYGVITVAFVRPGSLTSRQQVQAAAAVMSFRRCDLRIVNSRLRQRLTGHSELPVRGGDWREIPARVGGDAVGP